LAIFAAIRRALSFVSSLARVDDNATQNFRIIRSAGKSLKHTRSGLLQTIRPSAACAASAASAASVDGAASAAPVAAFSSKL
jgi:hypothetical protein